MGSRFWGSGFRSQCLWMRFQGLDFRALGLRFHGLGCNFGAHGSAARSKGPGPNGFMVFGFSL